MRKPNSITDILTHIKYLTYSVEHHFWLNDLKKAKVFSTELKEYTTLLTEKMDKSMALSKIPAKTKRKNGKA